VKRSFSILKKPSPEEDLAAKKVLKEMTKVLTLEAGGNLLISSISKAAAVITPVVLSLVTEDWSKIFLLLLYPLALFPMSFLMHSSSSFSLLNILLPAILSYSVLLSLMPLDGIGLSL